MSASALTADAPATAPKPWYRLLYVQVLVAIVLGALLGTFDPVLAKNDWIKAMGDGFVSLIKMVIAPIIFCTAWSEFAVQAFEVNAVDYLLKPVRLERLGVALGKVTSGSSSAG